MSCCLTKKNPNYLSSASLSWESLPWEDPTKSFSFSIIFAFFFFASLGFLPHPFPMLGPSTASSPQLKESLESLLGAGHLFGLFLHGWQGNLCDIVVAFIIRMLSLFCGYFLSFLYLLVYFIYHT